MDPSRVPEAMPQMIALYAEQVFSKELDIIEGEEVCNTAEWYVEEAEANEVRKCLDVC